MKCEHLTLKASPTHVRVFSLLSIPMLCFSPFLTQFLLNSSVFPYLSFLSVLLCEHSVH